MHGATGLDPLDDGRSLLDLVCTSYESPETPDAAGKEVQDDSDNDEDDALDYSELCQITPENRDVCVDGN